MGVSAAITVVILLFGNQLMGLFTDTLALADLSMSMMRILTVGYIACAVTPEFIWYYAWGRRCFIPNMDICFHNCYRPCSSGLYNCRYDQNC